MSTHLTGPDLRVSPDVSDDGLTHPDLHLHREESPMTHTPDQIRRAEVAERVYYATSGAYCACCDMACDWLAAAEAVEADIREQEGGRWVKCDDVPPHEHPAGTRWRETRIVGGAWEGREHWEPTDPRIALVTDWASSDLRPLTDESVRELLARLDAAKEG